MKSLTLFCKMIHDVAPFLFIEPDILKVMPNEWLNRYQQINYRYNTNYINPKYYPSLYKLHIARIHHLEYVNEKDLSIIKSGLKEVHKEYLNYTLNRFRRN